MSQQALQILLSSQSTPSTSTTKENGKNYVSYYYCMSTQIYHSDSKKNVPLYMIC